MDQLSDLLRAGMACARFDFTTGSRTLEDHLDTLKNLNEARRRTKHMCAVYCHVGGNVFAVSKRTKDTRVAFTAGQTVTLTHGAPTCDGSDVLPMGSNSVEDELDFTTSFSAGDVVNVHPYLWAGESASTAELEVESVSEEVVTCRCRNSAEIPQECEMMSVNFSKGAKNVINACDEGNLKRFAVPNNVDFVSCGAIRSAETLRMLKQLLKQWGLPKTRVIAHVDNLHALRDLKDVVTESEVVLLARGELGAVIEPEKMFAIQKTVLRTCERIGRPCVVTRLMDSMVFAPRPTRAEATDVANIVLDGADGLLLGLETLQGMFPLPCLQTVISIAREADAVYDYESRYRRQMQQVNEKLAAVTDDGDAKSERDRKLSRTKSANVLQMTKALQKEALAAAAVQTAYHVEAKLIVVFSHTGETTRLVARYHPHCVVLSLSIPTVRGGTLKWTVEGDQEARQQMLYRGVVPALSAGQPSAIDEEDDSDDEYDTIEDAGQSRTDREAMTTAHELGLIKPGELAVFCQLIGGLSTVKVVEFAGLDGGVATTFSPTASRSSSPSLFASGSPRSGGRAAGNVGNLGGVGTSTDLARLNIVDVAEIMSGDPDLMQRSPPLVVGGGPKRPPRGPAARGSSFRSRGSRSSMSSMASTKEK